MVSWTPTIKNLIILSLILTTRQKLLLWFAHQISLSYSTETTLYIIKPLPPAKCHREPPPPLPSPHEHSSSTNKTTLNTCTLLLLVLLMRCKKHPGDLSSGVGVCASCLRERLFALIAAQAQIQQQQQIAQLSKAHHHNHQHSRAAAVIDESRKSDSNSQYLQQPPPPLIFPRSVSPYVARRKSDDSASWSHDNQHHNLRFYSTPQLGPTYITPSSTTSTAACKKQSHKFSLFSNIFRSRSDKLKSDATGCGDSIEPPSSSSPFWFSTIFSGRRRKQSRQSPMEYSGPVSGEHRQRWDRGMSPAGGADSDKDCENCDRSPSGSGYSSESSMAWKKTPVASVGMRRGKAGQARNVSGLAFCLSPLVRASPKRNWNQKGGLPPELGLSGEFRAPVRPHLSTAASFCANRSRKLADFGRVNHNR